MTVDGGFAWFADDESAGVLEPADVPGRLLGVEGKYGEAFGLTNDFGARIIKHVGNYGEIFEKNLGQGSRMKISRAPAGSTLL